MKDYFVGLGAVLGVIVALATLPLWLPVGVVLALVTVIPWHVGKAIREREPS